MRVGGWRLHFIALGTDRIALQYAAPACVAEAIEAHAGYLRNELPAERIERRESPAGTGLSLAGEEILGEPR